MKRDEARALAEELSAQCAARLPIPVGEPRFPVGFRQEDIVREYIMRALDRALTPTRIEAAVTDLVAAAERWAGPEPALSFGHEMDQAVALSKDLGERITRLRALREQAHAEECGSIARRQTRAVTVEDARPYRDCEIRCHLPRGHEGEHEGELGTWRWA